MTSEACLVPVLHSDEETLISNSRIGHHRGFASRHRAVPPSGLGIRPDQRVEVGERFRLCWPSGTRSNWRALLTLVGVW